MTSNDMIFSLFTNFTQLVLSSSSIGYTHMYAYVCIYIMSVGGSSAPTKVVNILEKNNYDVYHFEDQILLG